MVGKKNGKVHIVTLNSAFYNWKIDSPILGPDTRFQALYKSVGPDVSTFQNIGAADILSRKSVCPASNRRVHLQLVTSVCPENGDNHSTAG